MASQLELVLDGRAVAESDLEPLLELQAEEAIDQADAVTISARLEPRPDGSWSSLLDPVTVPNTPMTVRIARGGVEYRFEGCSAEAAWHVDTEAGSRLTVKAIDLTQQMDLEEKVVPWPGTADSAIATAIFASYGLPASVEETPAGPDPDVHVAIQRATDWAYLRSLAAKWGYAVYLEAVAGRMVGHFRPLDPLSQPQGELPIGFATTTRAEISAGLVAGRRVEATRIPTLSASSVVADEDGTDQAQGPRTLGGQTTVLLAPTDLDGELDVAAAAAGLARRSAFGLRLNAELDTEVLGLMLRARRTVLVRGVGEALSGRWLVERVRHLVTLDGFRQQVSLVRNAFGLRGDEFGMAAIGGLP